MSMLETPIRAPGSESLSLQYFTTADSKLALPSELPKSTSDRAFLRLQEGADLTWQLYHEILSRLTDCRLH